MSFQVEAAEKCASTILTSKRLTFTVCTNVNFDIVQPRVEFIAIDTLIGWIHFSVSGTHVELDFPVASTLRGQKRIEIFYILHWKRFGVPSSLQNWSVQNWSHLVAMRTQRWQVRGDGCVFCSLTELHTRVQLVHRWLGQMWVLGALA